MNQEIPNKSSNTNPKIHAIPIFAWLKRKNESDSNDVSDTSHTANPNYTSRQSAEEHTNDHGWWLDSGHPCYEQGEKILSRFLPVLKPHTDSMGDTPSPELFVRLMLKTFVIYWTEIAEKYQCNDQDLKQLSPTSLPAESDHQARKFFGIFPPDDIVVPMEFEDGMSAFQWLTEADSLPDTVMPETLDQYGQNVDRFFVIILRCSALINGGGVIIRMLSDKHELRLRAVVKEGYEYTVWYDRPADDRFNYVYSNAEAHGVNVRDVEFRDDGLPVPGKNGAELIYLDL